MVYSATESYLRQVTHDFFQTPIAAVRCVPAPHVRCRLDRLRAGRRASAYRDTDQDGDLCCPDGNRDGYATNRCRNTRAADCYTCSANRDSGPTDGHARAAYRYACPTNRNTSAAHCYT